MSLSRVREENCAEKKARENKVGPDRGPLVYELGILARASIRRILTSPANFKCIAVYLLLVYMYIQLVGEAAYWIGASGYKAKVSSLHGGIFSALGHAPEAAHCKRSTCALCAILIGPSPGGSILDAAHSSGQSLEVETIYDRRRWRICK